MGSDQSSLSGLSKKKGKNPKRSHSAGNDKENEFFSRKGSSSPRPSICSDTDIPYMSYTTTRPISEEVPAERKYKWSDIKPRARDKQINREKRDNKARSVGSIVVVKPACEIPTVDKDPLYKRLEEIPPFTPIIRGSNSGSLTWIKDSDIADKIDPTPLLRIAFLYQERLRNHDESLKSKQTQLVERIKEADALVYNIMKMLSNRQKTFTNFVEAFSRINDFTNSLSSCHYALNKTIEAIETLNNMLAMDNRLEPFVWTTG